MIIIAQNNTGDYMSQESYLKLVKEKTPKEDSLKNAFISFLSGGVLGILAEVLVVIYMGLLNLDKESASTLMTITFVLLGVVLTGAGVFDDLINKYRFGLIIPITGFASSVASSLMEYKKEGAITGLGANMFKLAGAVILYGIISVFFLALIKGVIYG